MAKVRSFLHDEFDLKNIRHMFLVVLLATPLTVILMLYFLLLVHDVGCSGAWPKEIIDICL